MPPNKHAQSATIVHCRLSRLQARPSHWPLLIRLFVFGAMLLGAVWEDMQNLQQRDESHWGLMRADGKFGLSREVNRW